MGVLSLVTWWKEGEKEGRKEGRKEGKKEGRKVVLYMFRIY
jgi:predicted transposase YdaD